MSKLVPHAKRVFRLPSLVGVWGSLATKPPTNCQGCVALHEGQNTCPGISDKLLKVSQSQCKPVGISTPDVGQRVITKCADGICWVCMAAFLRAGESCLKLPASGA